MATANIGKEEVQEHLQKLAKIRPPEDRPTEKEVINMILRMKKRWGIL